MREFKSIDWKEVWRETDKSYKGGDWDEQKRDIQRIVNKQLRKGKK